MYTKYILIIVITNEIVAIFNEFLDSIEQIGLKFWLNFKQMVGRLDNLEVVIKEFLYQMSFYKIEFSVKNKR